MEREVAWLLEVAVNPGELDNFRALMDEMVASTRAEPGAVTYGGFSATMAAWWPSPSDTQIPPRS